MLAARRSCRSGADRCRGVRRRDSRTELRLRRRRRHRRRRRIRLGGRSPRSGGAATRRRRRWPGARSRARLCGARPPSVLPRPSGSAFAFAGTGVTSTLAFLTLPHSSSCRPSPRPRGQSVPALQRLSPAAPLHEVPHSSIIWRACNYAEFGHSVLRKGGRVAREIHDGLAQYLFAISAHVSMLEASADLDGAAAAEAGRRGGAAGGALRRARPLVGERHGAVRCCIAPVRGVPDRRRAARRRARHRPRRSACADEQIEIFGIVQEGLANARRHARPAAPR